MDPITLSSLIGAGSSLLGGLFGKGPSSGQQAQSHVDGIMAAAEKHKINPLTLLGSVAPQSGAAPVMGQAIANAGLSIADGMVKKADFDLQAEQLRMQNQRLQKSLEQVTLRPKVAGVYGNENASSPLVDSNKNQYPDAIVRSADGLLAKDPLDPRRSVQNVPLKTTGGTMRVDNPYLPFDIISLTLDGEEPLQWYDYPSLLIGGGIGFAELAADSVANPNFVPLSKRKPSFVPVSQRYKNIKLSAP